MSTIKVTLKDGTVREYPKGVTVQQVAEDISPGLARAAVGGEIDGEPVDYITHLEKTWN
jgi:threonyl-tRNA synthetase